ncbi:MAG: hypothetical protein PSX81_14880 [bacterium]|nr:hypothetical protein [bacterium]
MLYLIFAIDLKALTTILILFAANALFAQKNSLWVSSGYFYGDAKSKPPTDLTWGKSKSYTLGSGTNTQLSFQHQPDSSNWMFGTGLNLLIGNRNIVRSQIGENDTLKTATYTTNSVRLILQFGYLWTIKRLNFQLNAGLIIPITTQIKSEISYKDSLKNSTETALLKNYFSVGFRSSLVCTYRISKKVHFFVSLNQILLNSKVRKKTITGYQSSNQQDFNALYPNVSDKETLYIKDVMQVRNNPLLLPNSFQKNQPTEQLSYSQSYSSIGFQFGFQFLF